MTREYLCTDINNVHAYKTEHGTCTTSDCETAITYYANLAACVCELLQLYLFARSSAELSVLLILYFDLQVSTAFNTFKVI